MPEFYALQCFACEQFQVCQARKDKKFVCRLCGARQSVLHIHAKSDTVRPVREHVQRLNLTRGLASELYEESKLNEVIDVSQPDASNEVYVNGRSQEAIRSSMNRNFRLVPDKPSARESKWDSYLGIINSEELSGVDPSPGVEMRDDEKDDVYITALPDLTAHSRGRSKRMKASQRPGSGQGQEDSKRARRTGTSYLKADENEYRVPRRFSPRSSNENSNRDSSCRSLTQRPKRGTNTNHERLEDKTNDGVGFTLVAPGSDEVVEDEVYF